MQRWAVERGEIANTTHPLAVFAYTLHLKDSQSADAVITIEWFAVPDRPSVVSRIVFDRYCDELLAPGEQPALRVLVARDGSITVAEPAGYPRRHRRDP